MALLTLRLKNRRDVLREGDLSCGVGRQGGRCDRKTYAKHSQLSQPQWRASPHDSSFTIPDSGREYFDTRMTPELTLPHARGSHIARFRSIPVCRMRQSMTIRALTTSHWTEKTCFCESIREAASPRL